MQKLHSLEQCKTEEALKLQKEKAEFEKHTTVGKGESGEIQVSCILHNDAFCIIETSKLSAVLSTLAVAFQDFRQDFPQALPANARK